MSDRCHAGGWLRVAAPTTICLLALGYSYLLAGRFFNVDDDFYLVVAAQVARGARLYLDTAIWHTPISILLMSLLVREFGASLWLSAFASRLVAGLEGLWTYALARRLRMTPAWAALAAVFTLLWGIEMGVLGRNPYPYLCAGAFFASGALYFALSSSGPVGLLVAGVLGGFAFWSYQPSGAQIVLTLLIWLFLRGLGSIPSSSDIARRRRHALESLAYFLIGLGLVTLLVRLWASAPGQWREMLRLIGGPREQATMYLGCWRDLAKGFVPALAGGRDLVAYLANLGPQPFAAVAWILLVAAWLRQRAKLSADTAGILAGLLLYAGVGFLVASWQPLSYRVLLHVMPTLGLVACWWTSEWPATGQSRSAPRVAAAALILFMLWGGGRVANNLRWQGHTPYPAPGGNLYMSAADARWLGEVVDRLHRQQPAGSRCFVLGRGGMLHLLSGTWPAGKYSSTTVALLGAQDFRNCWQEIDRARPRHVYGFLPHLTDLEKQPLAEPLRDGLKRDYVRGYTSRAHAGEFVVWDRLGEGNTTGREP